MDLAALRQLFPVTQKFIFLNNAAESPLNTRFSQRLEAYLQVAGEAPQNKPGVRALVRQRLSELLGGAPEDYALVTSTGTGVGIVAAGYPWKKGDNVVVPADEHWNNTFPWLALKDRGVEVRLVPVGPDNRINPAHIEALTDDHTRIVAVAAVRFNSGFRSDLKKLSAIAHSRGALLMIDGIQGAGVVPLNIEEDGIDILACAGFKWLLGMPGTGFLYINKRAQEQIKPVMPGMFAAEDNTRELIFYPDARQYETGSIAYSLFYAWTAGLELLKEIGIDTIHHRAIALTDHMIQGLAGKKVTITSPISAPGERSAIVTFSAGSPEKNQAVFEKLKSRGIIISLRGGICRVSPNFFNMEEEIDRLLELLD